MIRTLVGVLVILSWAASIAFAGGHRTMGGKGAVVYFISPADGATVSNPVTIRFGLKGMGVAPAGVERRKTGHHHLIIDSKLESYDDPIPSDDQHKHFGGGQTETTMTLSPGKHTLQLILGDHNHIPHDKPVQSKVITITVK